MSLLGSLQQFDIDPIDFLTILGTVGLGLFFLLASLAAPVLAAATELVYVAKRKAFYDKCALQISQTAFAAGMFIFMVVGFSVSIGLSLYQPEMLEPPLIWRPVALFAAPLAVLCLLALYIAAWNSLKKLRALHLLLGFIVALLCLALLLFGFLLLTCIQEPGLSIALWDTPLLVLRALLDDFLVLPHQWLMTAFLFCTGMASAGGLAQLWLIMRRFKADYGRDYYAFAMRYCARLALVFILAATALGAAIFFRLKAAIPPEFSQPLEPGIMIVALGMPLVCCLLWGLICKSDTPLRHKAGAFFACLFLIFSLCAQLMMMLSTFPLV